MLTKLKSCINAAVETSFGRKSFCGSFFVVCYHEKNFYCSIIFDNDGKELSGILQRRIISIKIIGG